jgi:pimeloyl-ACP methyl ester carboxylesterase
MKKWLRRVALGVVGLLLLAAVLGAGYEALGRRRAARDFPPPGRLVDVGGRRIQIDCRGAGAPTVVFESGLDMAGSLSWSTVHDSVARTTRACAYSRAGIMWSDPPGRVQSGAHVADDLHAALAAADERPPYVLVGHSLGGPYAMIYTKRFGDEVAGLVFVDASHPDQVRRLAALPMPSLAESVRPLRIAAALAPVGVVRAVAAATDSAPPHPAGDVRATAAFASTSLRAMIAEADAFDGTLAEAGSARHLGDRPLFVLTAAAPTPAEELGAMGLGPEQDRQRADLWTTMQDEQATWSTRSQHRLVPDAGHYIQLDRPDLVIAAVRSVVDSVRARVTDGPPHSSSAGAPRSSRAEGRPASGGA